MDALFSQPNVARQQVGERKTLKAEEAEYSTEGTCLFKAAYAVSHFSLREPSFLILGRIFIYSCFEHDVFGPLE